MNIREAARQLELTVKSYTARDESGAYLIPAASQRPVYLLGAPGLGKTAIVSQVAERMGIGLVSYTMTHHTRQSALGLPQLIPMEVNGRSITFTEYTMPEIFAGVHRCIRDTGAERGILFLDEINCVSETLMPAMLELLQKKRFGRYPLPEGWVVVCAGNPERYNRSARAFDAVTLDRLRVIEVDSDPGAWLDHAAEHGVHDAVRGYLLLRPEALCVSDGDSIVTPRSWTDLSDLLLALDRLGESAGRGEFAQYLQIPRVCEGFALYYALCTGVAGRFLSDGVLRGEETDITFAGRPFEEQLCGAMLLLGALERGVRDVKTGETLNRRLGYFADGVLSEKDADPRTACQSHLERLRKALRVRREAGALSAEAERDELRFLHAASALAERVSAAADPVKALKSERENAGGNDSVRGMCRCALAFAAKAFDNTHVLVILLAELKRCAELSSAVKSEAADLLNALEERCDPSARAAALRAGNFRQEMRSDP